MKRGSLVLCINDNWSEDVSERFEVLPVKNGVYRIRKIYPNIDDINGPEGVALEGIYGAVLPFNTYWGELIYAECHFRKARFVEILPPIGEKLQNENEQPLKIKEYVN